MRIRESNAQDLSILALLIREANKVVAVKFGLNAENCPNHPSFCTESWIETDLARGVRYFIIEQEATPIGCVAYESPRPGRAYLNRLSVLPVHQCQGAGARLVQHIIDHARVSGVDTISIGVIGEYVELQSWYNKLGFKDGETKQFPHLPFSVKYMTYNVQDA